jgi:hypothetical protein
VIMNDHSYGTRRNVIIAAGLLYAAAAAVTEPLTAPATVAWLVPAAAVLILAGLRTDSEPAVAGRPVRRTALAWGALVGLAFALELVAWLQQPAYNVGSRDHPTISLLLDPALEPWPVRFAAWAVWLWVGWRVVRP